MRRPTGLRQPARRATASPAAFPAPTKGWMTAAPLAGMPAEAAVLLDNWFPEANGLSPRRGSRLYASGLGGRAVESLFSFTSGPLARLFAAAGPNVYDVTDASRPVAVLTSQSSARWQAVPFTVAGGPQLCLFNGVDAPQRFDGASWAPLAFTSTAPSFDIKKLSAACVYAGRLWMVQGTTIYYPPVDQFGGALQALQVGGELQNGGQLVAIARWTQTAGETIQDVLVVISDQGEVVAFSGTDPSAASWSKVGKYDIGIPLGGPRCTARLGGDLAILTQDGVQAMSKVLQLDRAEASNKGAFTAAIRPTFKDDAEAFGSLFGWGLHVHRERGALYVNFPLAENIGLSRQYVMNVQTGAWARFIGLNAICWHTFQGRLYFGATNGQVVQADVGYGDLGETTGYAAISAFKAPGGPGRIKQAKLMRAHVVARAPVRMALGLAVDFYLDLPEGLTNPQSLGSSRFARSQFGAPSQDWTDAQGVGAYFATAVYMELGPDTPAGADPRVIGFDVLFEGGGNL